MPEYSPRSRRQFLRDIGATALAAGAFSAAAGHARAETANPAPVSQATDEPTPRWDQVYDAALGGSAMGYVYAVARNGQPVAAAGVHLAPSASEKTNAIQPWTADTLFNLASVSKTITAVSIMTIVQQQGLQVLDSAFWPILTGSGRFSGKPGNGVDSVTLRQLLAMYSGLVEDGTLYARTGTVDQFLAAYLQKDVAHRPGSTYNYSNTNFTILQVLYEILSGAAPGSYVQLVKDNVLTPFGIDTVHELTEVPDPDNEALAYNGGNDMRPGFAWDQMQCVGPGGWLGTANGVLKFLVGLRGNAVLQPQTAEMMFSQELGWYRADSRYGSYYHHNGGLATGGGSPRQVHTGAVRFPAGYDAVLFVNSSARPIQLMAQAFGAGPPTRSAPE